MVAFAMSRVERATVKQESFCVSWFLLCILTGAITGYYAPRLLVVMLVDANVDASSQLISSLVGVATGALLGSFLDYTLSNANTHGLRRNLCWIVVVIWILLAMLAPDVVPARE